MANKIKLKEILKDKFWIVEDSGENVGTISLNEDKNYMLSNASGVRFCKDVRSLKKQLNAEITWSTAVEDETAPEHEIYDFPTSCSPYNPMYDVKRRLALFTKSVKSKSLYCAGYFIIRFEKGWVKSFCPKLITIERYESKGPFKTELEMRTELSKANAKR
jgi:hypothetical protein